MAGYVVRGSYAIDYADGEGSCVVKGIRYLWTFHEWGGPCFYRVSNGEEITVWSPKPRVWKAFDKWFKKYRKARKLAKSWETVKV